LEPEHSGRYAEGIRSRRWALTGAQIAAGDLDVAVVGQLPATNLPLGDQFEAGSMQVIGPLIAAAARPPISSLFIVEHWLQSQFSETMARVSARKPEADYRGE
jgi:hypothetical protein